MQTKIRDLNYVNKEEYNKTIYQWNKTDANYPDTKTIHQLFEEQVQETPNSIALVCGEIKLTYKELNDKANQLANYIRQINKINPDTIIALCLNANEQMLISILGVLKSGGAYVPIDPSHPEDRISYILQDTLATVVITNELYEEKLNYCSLEFTSILSIDSSECQSALSFCSKDNLSYSSSSSDLAYVIYTSGTTGQPKGVMIEHKSITNYKIAITQVFKLTPFDSYLMLSNYIFDLGYTSVWCSLLSGATIHLVTYDQIFLIKKIREYIKNYKISVIKITFSYLKLLLNKKNSITFDHSIKIILGGEKLTNDVLSYLSDNIILYNHYGPTESTIGCITHNINSALIQKFFVSKSIIGRPINNIKAYVLDQNLATLPIGEVGELYIAGVGLARGYLNKEDLTSKNFIHNPFQTESEKLYGKNTKLYKTGDCVRWLPDGNLEYIGRSDLQVKIMGYRIELSEIEDLLCKYEGVSESIVLAKENIDINGKLTGNKYLVGYYVSEKPLNEDAILKQMESKLPQYMIPAILMHMSKFPLTANNKLDRKALPDPIFV